MQNRKFFLEGCPMAYFPFFVDIDGRNGLIVGGGKIALHKLQKLLPYEPVLKIVAPEISVDLKQIALENNICVIERLFERSDLTQMYFVIAASDNADVNAEIGKLCREQNILVNVVDNKELCSFLFPSLVKMGNLSIGISTEGTSPEIAAEMRSRIASMVPADMDAILVYLGSLRTLAKTYIEEDSKRALFLKEMARVCMDCNTVFDEQETMRRMEYYIYCEKTSATKVLLVGAGCSSFDLITMRGLRAIRQAQVLVYDDLIDQRLLEHASERCERIYVGKRSGKHSMSQEQINTLLVQKAKEGSLVVRLKGGDPFVFGRGMEEMLALRRANICVEYIPGVTSCITIPALAGIPVTHREISRSFHVITGHLAGRDLSENLGLDFAVLAQLEGTLVFLMGISQLQQIVEGLICAGKESSTPIAVIHGNFDASVESVCGTLTDIVAKVEESMIQKPAVIVIGAVVALMCKCP